MPIYCPIELPRLTTEQFKTLDYRVMAEAFACHNALGHLADEAIYQADFTDRLNHAGLSTRREVPVTVSFETFQKNYFLDLVVAVMAVYEAKTVAQITDEHIRQLMNYLLLLDLPRGKIINFRPSSVKSVFVNAPARRCDRQRFSVDASRWVGGPSLLALIESLLRDWGTGLQVALYCQALAHFLNGPATDGTLLPMRRDSVSLGNQRFLLADAATGLRITAFSQTTADYELNLLKLLMHSPLQAMHWVNITLKDVSFITLRR